MSLLSIDNIRLQFYGVHALDGASFDVDHSGITGLIGPNGAGKTTLFNVLSGIYKPDSGRIAFVGEDITGLPPERITGKGLVRTFQIARGFPRLTVFEHLLLYGQSQPGERILAAIFGSRAAREHEAQLAERAWEIVRRLNLSTVVDRPIVEISGGQKKLVEIGRVLMTDPKMILLDEPTAGVNPTLTMEIGAHLKDLAASGNTILLIEHDMTLIRDVCQDVIVMAEGKMLARGPFAEVAANVDVQAAYLGVAV